jgi:hypothetical protein
MACMLTGIGSVAAVASFIPPLPADVLADRRQHPPPRHTQQLGLIPRRVIMMRALFALIIGFGVSLGGPAFAQTSTCKAQSAEKKLAGAALTSFMKKCEADAAKGCDASAKEKKLAGAAKTCFEKKCLSDAVGT